MIRISNLSLELDQDPSLLVKKASRVLGISPEEIQKITLDRQSIDARKKSQLRYVCTVTVQTRRDAELVRRADNPHIMLYTPQTYSFPSPTRTSLLRPVVVGTGPAGLFSALFLARAGIPPVILERGRPVEARSRDVENFWRSGRLDPVSNVQFGEGGAGTFSDGKLTTGTHDPRLSAVLDEFVAHGAPADILWSHKPHIGTDILREVVKTIRLELLRLGCDIRFEHCLSGVTLREHALRSISVTGPSGSYSLETDTLILAPGHSARDTFRMLFDAGIPMEGKSFAIGVRIEHLQREISASQYGPSWERLPPSDYKLSCHLPDGRSAFTFCVCPGGQVVAAASESQRLVTNGMSLRARDGKNSNGGLLVGVSPSDFTSPHPLAGLAFQEFWEEKAYQLGGGNYTAPAQTVGSLLSGGTPRISDRVTPTYLPGVIPADLPQCLPPFVTDTLKGALPLMGHKLRGFDSPDALLTGVETRSSSPVRLLRGADLQSPVRGLYPCGEGGGWAGGIMSAAADGIRVAEQVASPTLK